MSFSKMCFERSVPCENFAAVLTIVALLVVNSCDVFIQRGLLTEFQMTRGTLESLHFLMDNFDMVGQLVLDGKGFWASITDKWSFF